MGMTYRQFWLEDCRLVIDYRKAYKLRQEEQNRAAWLNGVYIYKALQSAMINVQGFVPKNAKIEPYPTQPIDFFRKEKTEQEQVDDEAREKSERIKRNMLAFMKAQEAQKKEEELKSLMEGGIEHV